MENVDLSDIKRTKVIKFQFNSTSPNGIRRPKYMHSVLTKGYLVTVQRKTFHTDRKTFKLSDIQCVCIYVYADGTTVNGCTYKYLTSVVMIYLYKCQIILKMEYCHHIWAGATQSSLSKGIPFLSSTSSDFHSQDPPCYVHGGKPS